MNVYHTSTLIVNHPEVAYSRNYLDFGKGVYLTTLRQQAVNYAERFRMRGKHAFLNEYVLDEMAYQTCSVRTFQHYDEEWLDFVAACRRGDDSSIEDIIIGGIANDRIFRTIDLYFSGEMNKEEALKRLKYEEPNNQICIRHQQVIDQYLHFLQSEELV